VFFHISLTSKFISGVECL